MENIYKTPCLYGTAFYNGKNCAICFIDEYGKTHLKTKKQKSPLVKHNFFFIRGLEYLFIGIWYFFSNLVQASYIPNKVSYKMSKNLNITSNQIMVFIISIISIFVGFFLFGFLPIRFSVIISGYSYNMFVKKLLVGLFKIMLLYFSLMSLKLFDSFKQFYRFNASLNSDQKTSKVIHKPTNFLNYIVFGFMLNMLVVSLIGLTVNAIYKPIINILISVFVFGITYEFLLLIEKTKISKICIITSWLVTQKTTTTENYCAEIARQEVKLMQNKKREKQTQPSSNDINFSIVYAETKQKLASAGIEDISDTDWLICEVLGCKRSALRLKSTITSKQYKEIQNAVAKRIKGCPITKIFGRTEFYGLEFKVTKDVLSPRMETEILVEEVLKNISEKTEVLDIGTGSGIIAICVAKFGKAKVTAIDVSDKALAVASLNAENNGVKINFKNSNLFENLKKSKKFDIIVSNPPYIKTEDISSLDVEVKNFDPILALDGGKNGLEFYEKIIKIAPSYIAENGKIFFEVGKGQAKDVAKLLETDFDNIKIIKDYNHINRVVVAKLKNKGKNNARTNNKNKAKI